MVSLPSWKNPTLERSLLSLRQRTVSLRGRADRCAASAPRVRGEGGRLRPTRRLLACRKGLRRTKNLRAAKHWIAVSDTQPPVVRTAPHSARPAPEVAHA